MLRTVECEAVVFGCPTLDHGPADDVLAAPGVEHLLARLPADRWGVVTDVPEDAVADHYGAADLPRPPVAVSTAERAPAHFAEAAQLLGADPLFCLALEHTADGVEAALGAGMKVIAICRDADPDGFGAADMVVPTLRSLHVVGTHPVLVFEVDALPNVGTFNPGPHRRR